MKENNAKKRLGNSEKEEVVVKTSRSLNWYPHVKGIRVRQLISSLETVTTFFLVVLSSNKTTRGVD